MLLLKLASVMISDRNISARLALQTSPCRGQHWVKGIPEEASVQKIWTSLSKRGREMNPKVEKAVWKHIHLEQMLPERGRRVKNRSHVNQSQPGIQGEGTGWPQREPFQIVRGNSQQRGRLSESVLVVKRCDADRTRKMGFALKVFC